MPRLPALVFKILRYNPTQRVSIIDRSIWKNSLSWSCVDKQATRTFTPERPYRCTCHQDPLEVRPDFWLCTRKQRHIEYVLPIMIAWSLPDIGLLITLNACRRPRNNRIVSVYYSCICGQRGTFMSGISLWLDVSSSGACLWSYV